MYVQQQSACPTDGAEGRIARVRRGAEVYPLAVPARLPGWTAPLPLAKAGAPRVLAGISARPLFTIYVSLRSHDTTHCVFTA